MRSNRTAPREPLSTPVRKFVEQFEEVTRVLADDVSRDPTRVAAARDIVIVYLARRGIVSGLEANLGNFVCAAVEIMSEIIALRTLGTDITFEITEARDFPADRPLGAVRLVTLDRDPDETGRERTPT